MKDSFLFQSNFKEVADKLPDDLRLKFYDAITDYAFNGTMPDDVVIAALITAISLNLDSMTNLDKKNVRGGVREGAGRKSKIIKNNQNNQNVVFDSFEKNQNNQKNQSGVFDSFEKNQKEEKETKEKKNPPLNPSEENKNNKNIYTPLYVSPLDEKEAEAEESVCKDNREDEFREEGCVDKVPKKKFTPPSLDEIKAYIVERGAESLVDAQKFYDYFTVGGWKDSAGKPVKNWKQKLITWEISGRRDRTIKAAAGLINVQTSPQESMRTHFMPVTDEYRRAWLRGEV